MSWWKVSTEEDETVEKETPPIVQELTAKQALNLAIGSAVCPFALPLASYAWAQVLDFPTRGVNPMCWLFFVIAFYLAYTNFQDYRTIRRTGKPILITREVVAERQSQMGRYLLRCGMGLLFLVAALSCLFLGLTFLHHKHPLPTIFWGVNGLFEIAGWIGVRHGWNKLNAFDAKRLHAAAKDANLKASVTDEETPVAPKHWWTSNDVRDEVQETRRR